ncbi:MAG TPA: thioesterase family protein [Terriglobales bacterium]|nr:thioesterase family protein [Terriglobales bacterium]
MTGATSGAAAEYTETQVRVRYAETDQMGVVYYANYFVWWEVGRVEHLRARGINYRDMETDGCKIAVVDARCRYKAPARYDDVVTIRTRVARQRGSIVHFEYQAVRARDGLLLAEGETVHVCIDNNFQACALPEKYQATLGGVMG